MRLDSDLILPLHVMIIEASRRDSIGQGAAFLARILQYMETPQYLRK